MDMKRLLGVVFFVVGVTLIGIAYQSTGAPIEEISSMITIRYSEETVMYFVFGIGAAISGGFLAVLGSWT